MTRHALLNNVTHKALRVITRYGAEFGDDIGSVRTFPTEFAEMQREYPIFFRRDSVTGQYESVALLGLEKGENLFLESGRWNASYVPGMIARGPFLIGFQRQEVDGEQREEPVIHVDLDHPHVSQTEGTPVFMPHGGNSAYLDHIATVLRGIRDGVEVGKAMVTAFSTMNLIEPVKLDIKLDEVHGYSIVGMHTISRERLGALDAASLESLNRTGFLEGAFLVAASINNVRSLMAKKRARLSRSANLEMPAGA